MSDYLNDAKVTEEWVPIAVTYDDSEPQLRCPELFLDGKLAFFSRLERQAFERRMFNPRGRNPRRYAVQAFGRVVSKKDRA